MTFSQTSEPVVGDTIATFVTSMGDIQVRLFPEHAPKTVENFTTLAKDGKYDKTIFHRIIADFMIQGGDYTNHNGTGGKSMWGTEFEDEFHDDLTHLKGALSMANAGPGTNGSQFFIVHAPETSWLDRGHTVFGQLVEGGDVLDEIASVDVNGMDKPLEDLILETVLIETHE